MKDDIHSLPYSIFMNLEGKFIYAEKPKEKSTVLSALL